MMDGGTTRRNGRKQKRTKQCQTYIQCFMKI